MTKLIGRALVALAAFLFAPAVAMAQASTENTLPRGIFEPSGRQQVQTAPTALITKDSVSGNWCIVGSTATCVLPGTGGGGGGGDATAAKQDEQIVVLEAIKTAAEDPTPVAVDVEVGGGPAAAGAGGASATTLRVVPASDGVIGLDARATGGCTPYGYQSAASNNATNVKASAATLCGGMVINTTSTLYYLRLYNLTSAPTCSSATGFVATIPVPASTSGAGTLIQTGSYGWAFGTGLGFCLTGGGVSTDNTNAATGVYLVLGYK